MNAPEPASPLPLAAASCSRILRVASSPSHSCSRRSRPTPVGTRHAHYAVGTCRAHYAVGTRRAHTRRSDRPSRCAIGSLTHAAGTRVSALCASAHRPGPSSFRSRRSAGGGGQRATLWLRPGLGALPPQRIPSGGPFPHARGQCGSRGAAYPQCAPLLACRLRGPGPKAGRRGPARRRGNVGLGAGL